MGTGYRSSLLTATADGAAAARGSRLRLACRRAPRTPPRRAPRRAALLLLRTAAARPPLSPPAPSRPTVARFALAARTAGRVNNQLHKKRRQFEAGEYPPPPAAPAAAYAQPAPLVGGPSGAYGGRCALNPNCVRGYKHGGKGGPCKLRWSLAAGAAAPAPPSPDGGGGARIVGVFHEEGARLWSAGVVCGQSPAPGQPQGPEGAQLLVHFDGDPPDLIVPVNVDADEWAWEGSAGAAALRQASAPRPLAAAMPPPPPPITATSSGESPDLLSGVIGSPELSGAFGDECLQACDDPDEPDTDAAVPAPWSPPRTYAPVAPGSGPRPRRSPPPPPPARRSPPPRAPHSLYLSCCLATLATCLPRRVRRAAAAPARARRGRGGGAAGSRRRELFARRL